MAQPVQIVSLKKGTGIELNMEAVRKILLDSNVRNKPVVVISVAGAFRTGKSFLMNIVLSYLRHHCQEPMWLSDRSAPVQGFSWEGGIERHTTGIWLWNEVFVVKRHQGDEVAVVLMDTHGMFDSDTAFKDLLSMFAFTASVSSVLLYNLTHNIQEDDLQRLGTLVDYGRMALGKKPMECVFQKLVLIVRDWNFPMAAPYGEEGGKKILDSRLREGGGVPSEGRTLRGNIRSAFKDIHCFLLPYPGPQVATANSTDGPLYKVDDDFRDFRDSVKDFLHFLLTPDKLAVKEACGREITCEGLASAFETLIDAVSAKICNPTLSSKETPQTFEKCFKYNNKKQFAVIRTPSKLLKFLFLGLSFIIACTWACVGAIAKMLDVSACIDTVGKRTSPKETHWPLEEVVKSHNRKRKHALIIISLCVVVIVMVLVVLTVAKTAIERHGYPNWCELLFVVCIGSMVAIISVVHERRSKRGLHSGNRHPRYMDQPAEDQCGTVARHLRTAITGVAAADTSAPPGQLIG